MGAQLILVDSRWLMRQTILSIILVFKNSKRELTAIIITYQSEYLELFYIIFICKNGKKNTSEVFYNYECSTLRQGLEKFYKSC